VSENRNIANRYVPTDRYIGLYNFPACSVSLVATSEGRTHVEIPERRNIYNVF
jgi:hypothetical protein